VRSNEKTSGDTRCSPPFARRLDSPLLGEPGGLGSAMGSILPGGSLGGGNFSALFIGECVKMVFLLGSWSGDPDSAVWRGMSARLSNSNLLSPDPPLVGSPDFHPAKSELEI
jgi:hypothetical protein